MTSKVAGNAKCCYFLVVSDYFENTLQSQDEKESSSFELVKSSKVRKKIGTQKKSPFFKFRKQTKIIISHCAIKYTKITSSLN